MVIYYYISASLYTKEGDETGHGDRVVLMFGMKRMLRVWLFGLRAYDDNALNEYIFMFFST